MAKSRRMKRAQAARHAGVMESLESRLLMTTLYWDPSATAGLQSGSGTWSTGATNWNTQADGLGSRVAWTNGADAVFPTSGTSTITISGGVSANSVTISATGYTITASTLTMTGTNITASQDTTINSVLAGSSGIAFDGSATVTLGGANTYTGGTTISGGGVVSINADARLGGTPGSPATNVTFSGNSTLRMTGAFTLNANRNIAINSSVTGTIDNTAAVTISSVISGSGTLAKSGSAVLTLSGTNSNTYTGGTAISDGTLLISADDKLGTAPGSPTTNISFNGDSTLRFSAAITLNSNRSISIATSQTATIDTQASNSSYAGAISGGGNFIKDGGGDLSLSGTNTYGGTTRINGGSIIVSGGSALPDTTALTNATAVNATLTLNASETIGSMQGPGYIQLNSYTLTTGGDNTSTNFSGTASGSGGSIVKTGTGTFTLSGTNTYTGGTTINNGTLSIDANASLGGNPGSPTTNITFSGNSTLKFTAGMTLNANRNITVNNGVTATLDTSAVAVTIGSVISGSGGLKKIGTSVLTLSATNNTYSGGTEIAGGTVSIAGDGTLGSVPGSPTTNINFSDDGTLRFTNPFTLSTNRSITIASAKTATLDLQSNNVSYAGAISGSGSLVKDGGGDLSLSGTNTYGGSTDIDGGSIIVSGGSALPDTTAVTNATLVNATLTLNGNETIGSIAGPGYIQLNSYTLTTGGNGDSTTFSGAISGSGILAKAGSGSMIINNTLNSYSGGTEINGGTLQFNSNAALGANPGSPTVNITFTGNGTFLYGGAVSLNTNRNIQVNTGVTGTIDVDNNNVTIGSVISGSGNIIKAGTSTLTLSNTNTFTGTTRIAAGTLRLTSGTALQSSTLDMNGSDSGSLSFGSLTSATFGGLQGSRSLSLTNTSGAAVGTTVGGNNGSTEYSGVLSGTSATLTKTGSGTLTLSGTNTFTGSTTISNGTLQLGNGGSTGSVAGTITDNATLKVNQTGTLTISQVISGSGIVVQAGSGTLSLTATNTYSGGTQISSGTLQFNADAALGAAPGSPTVNITFTGSGTLLYNGAITLNTNRNIQVNASATGTIDVGSNNVTIGSVISGSGNITKAGANTLTLSNTNTFTGTTRIAAGTLTLSSGTALQSSTLDMNGSDSGSLSFGSLTSATLGGLQGSRNLTLNNTSSVAVATTVGGNNGSTTYSGVLGGAGSLTKTGSGTLTLTGNNTYTGSTTISAGTLQVGSGSSGATLSGTSGITNNSALIANHSDSLTIGVIIGGTGTLTQTGSGTLILTAANTYSGSTTISSGTLQIGNAGTTGSIDSTSTIVNNGTLAVNRTNSYTLSVSMSGTGNLSQNGSGTLTISSSNNSFLGTTRIVAGTLTLGAANALQKSTLDMNGSDSGSLSYGAFTSATFGGLQGSRTLALAADSTTFGLNNGSTTYSGVLTGSGAFVKNGSGTLILSTDSSYTGSTTVTDGTLQVGTGSTGGSLSTSSYRIDGILTFNRSSSFSISGVISGGGTLNQAGSGTITLTGANTFGGTTMVSAGTLTAGTGGTSGTLVGSTAFDITGTLILNLSSSYTLSNEQEFYGTGTIIKQGAGTATFTYNSNSTFTGNLRLGAGVVNVTASDAQNIPKTLKNVVLDLDGADSGTFDFGTLTSIQFGGLQGSRNLALVNASSAALELVVGGSGSTTIYSGVLSGIGSLKQSGAGTLVLTGTNTYSGSTTVERLSDVTPGTLQLGNNGTTGTVGGSITNNATLAIYRSDNFTYSQVVSGTGTLMKLGTNTVTITGANTFTGITRVAAGTLAIGSNATTLQYSMLDYNGADSGTFSFGTQTSVTLGGLMGSRNLALTNTTPANVALTLFVDSNRFLHQTYSAYSGVLSGGGSITKTGTATQIFSGTNTYSGGTTISAGTLQLGAGGTTGSIDLSALSNSGTLAFNRSDSVTVSNVLSGSGGLTQMGPGTLTLTGANTYTGATVTSAYTYSVSGGTKTNYDPGTLQIGNGGTSGSLFGSSSIVNNGILIFNHSNDETISNPMSGTGTLIKQNSNTLTLGMSGTNSNFSGTTRIAAGTLKLGSATALQYSTLDLNALDSGTFSFGTQTSPSLGALKGTRNLALTNETPASVALSIGGGNNSAVYSGVLSGGGSLAKSGTGTQTLAGTNTYSGTTSISAGTLQIGDGGTTGSYGAGALTLGSGGTLAYKRSDAVTISTAINGSGGNLRQMGSGTLSLTTTNGYSGTTTIDPGSTLQIGNGGANGSISSTSSILNNGTLVYNVSGSLSLSVAMSGTGSLVQQGSGTLTISSSSNSFTGTTRIAAGTLIVGHALALQDSTVDLNGSDSGTLSFGTVTSASFGGLQGSRNLALTNTTPASVALSVGGRNGASSTYSGLLSGGGSLTKTGTGTFTLTNTSNSYSGGTVISTGAMNFGGNSTSTTTTAGSGALSVSPTVDGVNHDAILGGSGTGIISVGNLSFGAGATYTAEVNSSTAGSGYDRLDVTGTISLNSATLMLSGTRSASNGQTITLIVNDSSDAISGTFYGLAEGAKVIIGDVPYTISYVGGTGNDVVLTDVSGTNDLTSFTLSNSGQISLEYQTIYDVITTQIPSVSYWLADGTRHNITNPTLVDTTANTLTYVSVHATIVVTLAHELNQLHVYVTTTNNSGDDLLGVRVDMGEALFPAAMPDTNDGTMVNFGGSEPNILNFPWSIATPGVVDGAAALVNELPAMSLFFKMTHNAPGGTEENRRGWSFASYNDEEGQGWPQFENVIANGQQQSMEVTLRFGEINPDSAIADYLVEHPYVVNSVDKRPMLPVFLNTGSLPSVSDTLTSLASGNYQGIIVWDIGGYDGYAYDGSPDSVSVMRQDINAAADAFFKAITDAGYKIGMTLRPGDLKFKDSTDINYPFGYYLDTAGMTNTDLNNSIIDKATYAYNRWGATLFYVDSNDPYYTDGMMRAAQLALPNCVFLAENHYGGAATLSSPLYFQTRNFTSANYLASMITTVQEARRTLDSRASVVIWTDDDPDRLGTTTQLNTTYTTLRDQLVELIRMGCTLMGRNVTVINYLYSLAALGT